MAYGIVIQQKVIDAMTMRRPTQFGSIVLHMEPHELRTKLKRRIKSILTTNWMSTKCSSMDKWFLQVLYAPN